MADSIHGVKNAGSPSVGVRQMVLRSQAGRVGRNYSVGVNLGGPVSNDDVSTRTQQLEAQVAALEEQLKRSSAGLPSDFSKDGDCVAGRSSTPQSDLSDGASDQASVDGVMEFSKDEIFDQLSFHFMSDVGSSLAKLGGEELNDIGVLLDLNLGERRAPRGRAPRFYPQHWFLYQAGLY